MKSLKLRFQEEGKTKEVIDYAKTYGVFSACDKFETGYIPMQKFLEGETGNENFGINPAINTSNSMVTATNLLDAFLNKVNQLQAENSKLKQELSELRKEVQYRKVEQSLLLEPKITHVMGVMKS